MRFRNLLDGAGDYVGLVQHPLQHPVQLVECMGIGAAVVTGSKRLVIGELVGVDLDDDAQRRVALAALPSGPDSWHHFMEVCGERSEPQGGRRLGYGVGSA